MGNIIYVELYKTFAKPRTYIGLIAIVILIALIQFGFYANKDEVATDAHWGAEMTYDYFKNMHGRNSFDNAGAKIVSYIHFCQTPLDCQCRKCRTPKPPR